MPTKVSNQSWRNNQSKQCVCRLLSYLISFSVCNMQSPISTSFINIAAFPNRVPPCLSTRHQHHQRHLSASLYTIIFNPCTPHSASTEYGLSMKAIRFYITPIINPSLTAPEGPTFPNCPHMSVRPIQHNKAPRH